MECPESGLKCFLHYGSEERAYFPNRNVEQSFEPQKVSSILELLSNDESAKNIVPTIVKVFRGGYSVEPFASMYALAMVVRKAGESMRKEKTTVENSDKEKNDPEKKTESEGKEAGESKPKTYPESDLLIREAYKAARKLSEDNAEYFLTFVHYLRSIARTEKKKGFGEGWRKTVKKWYSDKDPIVLAQEVTKLNSTAHWSHRDVLNLCRYKSPDDPATAAVVAFVQHSYRVAQEKYGSEAAAKSVLDFLKVTDQLRRAESDAALLNLITLHEISIEYCPDKFLNNHEVWLALIPRMSIDCLLSKINRMSRLKLFKHYEIITAVIRRFEQDGGETNIHPIYVYVTRKQYEEGPNLAIEFQYLQRRREIENSAENAGNDNSVALAAEVEQIQRQPPPRRSPEIIDCLNLFLNKTLSTLPPTGLRYLIGLDSQAAVQSRRCSFERFVNIEEAALLVALCVVKAESESNVKLVTFTRDAANPVKEIPVNKADETMETLKSKVNRDDCAPANVQELIQWATKNNQNFDVLILLGDNTLNPNGAHEALKSYQEKVSSKAKVITCCFIGRHKKHKELTKPDMFLICGFDKNVGRLIEACSRGAF